MSIYCTKFKQDLPISKEEAWEFISSPFNLKKITPPHLGFEITNSIVPGEKMYAGQIIVYRISPLPGLRSKWVTEITHVKDGEYFIDEQRFGPYDLWHHRHQLTTIPGGVCMEDTIHYKLPYGILGNFAHFLFVRNKQQSVFDYRRRELENLFGTIHDKKMLNL